ncbi:Gfo/Idh/MocA family protein [Paenibacillus sp. PAMC21692]|uniref:Gfo/Idh/MocA family protein n=1 Tax=Paenibacillus sp. PAMC21692 TaxID=2762320 RepID=UPI00164EC9A6|nr:Gfo/Idh/MocA family oxidoreductase [Paenibacillus sp. PAMC21692]QNK54921.1 Gfo/Idh/MocA family oxidoreductase [Paenibacillus sp. PAMC21692]
MGEKKFAIIGCQHNHIEIFIEQMYQSGYSCAGIFEEHDRTLAEVIAEKYEIPLVENKLSLLGEAIEIVGCASMNNEKIDVIELCEQYGKSIMVDKPAVVNQDGLARLEAIIERNRIKVGMLLTERFHPAIYTLKQYVDQGKLGELVHIGMRKPHKLNASSRPAWFFNKEQCGGILIDLLIHDYDLLRWFTGQEIKNSAGLVGKSVLPEHPTFYNTVNVQVELDDGLLTQLYADWHTPSKSWTWGDGRIFVTGTKGFAELRLSGDPLLGSSTPIMLYASEEEEWNMVDLIQPHATITADFLGFIRGEASLLTHEELIKASSAVLDADAAVLYKLIPSSKESGPHV